MRLIRPVLATLTTAAAALAMAASTAAPAAADELQRPPYTYHATDLGEDLCTTFETKGEVFFDFDSPAIGPTARFAGETGVQVAEDQICLDVVPFPRHVEFTVYDANGSPVAADRVPVVPVTEYDLTLVSTEGLRYVTVAVCVSEDIDPLPRQERCGEEVVLTPEAATGR